MKDKTDISFKDALRNRSCEPPAYLWEQIYRKLEQRKKNRKIFLWISSSAASIALVLSLLFIPEVKYKQQLNYKKITYWNSRKSLNFYFGKEKENTVVEVLSKISVIPSFSQNGIDYNQRKYEPVLRIDHSMKKGAIFNPIPYVEIQTPSIRTDIIALTNKENYQLNRLYQKMLSTTLEKTKTETRISKNKRKLSLSGHFAPGYASGSRNHLSANSRNYAYSKDQLSGIFSMSGGLKFSISGNKRLAFITGIIYTKMGQRTNKNSSNTPVVMSSIRQPQSGAVASPLGLIKSKTSTRVYYADYTTNLPGNTRTTAANIEQIFGALEIPLTVKYRLNNNKLAFNLLGGISGSFIVSNKAYLNYENHREFIGSTEDIRTFNWSADMALGIEYPLTPKIKFMIEPGFRYYLQSISKNEDIDFKPYVFSFSTGIGVNF